jgi:hypothetical protein
MNRILVDCVLRFMTTCSMVGGYCGLGRMVYPNGSQSLLGGRLDFCKQNQVVCLPKSNVGCLSEIPLKTVNLMVRMFVVSYILAISYIN